MHLPSSFDRWLTTEPDYPPVLDADCDITVTLTIRGPVEIDDEGKPYMPSAHDLVLAFVNAGRDAIEGADTGSLISHHITDVQLISKPRERG